MSTSNNKTVRLNVGGTKYEVARSTIEKYPGTMLARLISDTWEQQKKQDDSGEIFIDADGNQFQFVLQYMRHQEVHLPWNVAKGAVLKDLEYFGFENIPPDSISCSGANLEAAKHVRACKNIHKDVHSKMVVRADMTELAFQAYMSYVQGSEHFQTKEHFQYFIYNKLNEEHRTVFNECLAEYGLRYTAHHKALSGCAEVGVVALK